MFIEIVSWIAVALIVATSTAMLINRDWRVSLGALAVQYIAAFWLVTRHLPFVMGSAKLVTGWMVVAALGMTRLGLSHIEEENEETFWPRGRWFRMILIAIVTLVAAGSTPRIEAAIPGLGLQVIAGSLILIGAGVVHLGVTSNLLRVILGLLTMLTGFEILYAAIESSILVAGLLAVTNLGLGIVGSYLLIAGVYPPDSEDEETA
ncbi:MAG: hypothetical protein IPN96_14665 [Anaerolineales bacterium]|uniref:hypothetical protein n=1 Tax=Candidatus Villigracilis proximus TaxID=3140683 RepID=UPI00313622B4|nr:hypothetical protein [Anaerolineales bacterium]MBK9209955.1 hypothetical protein [Anaerolineales bacterium]